MTNRDVEITTKRVTTVDSVQEAFAFIMEHLDEVGDQPRIEIDPFTDLGAGIAQVFEDPEADLLGVVRFEVSITNMVVKERAGNGEG